MEDDNLSSPFAESISEGGNFSRTIFSRPKAPNVISLYSLDAIPWVPSHAAKIFQPLFWQWKRLERRIKLVNTTVLSFGAGPVL
jgi:hypothetical protein